MRAPARPRHRPAARSQLDTAIAAYLLDPAETRYDLGDLLGRYTGRHAADRRRARGPARPRRRRRPTTRCGAAREALAVSRLAPALGRRPRRPGHAPALRRDREPARARCWPAWRTSASASTSAELRRLNDRLTAECARLAGEVHARRRPRVQPQLAAAAAPDPVRRARPRAPEADQDRLLHRRGVARAAARPVARVIDPLLPYREVEKLRSTYGEGLLAEVAPDGRIHATFNQTVARTGRLSSDQPNLHNIPVRSEEGRQFRRAFVPAPGQRAAGRRLQPDRAALHRPPGRGPGLIAAFTERQDIHNATASRIFGVEPGGGHDRAAVEGEDGVATAWPTAWRPTGSASGSTSPPRRRPRSSTRTSIAFPNVKAYMDRTVNEARKRGYTETLFGRRRPIPELSSRRTTASARRASARP